MRALLARVDRRVVLAAVLSLSACEGRAPLTAVLNLSRSVLVFTQDNPKAQLRLENRGTANLCVTGVVSTSELFVVTSPRPEQLAFNEEAVVEIELADRPVAQTETAALTISYAPIEPTMAAQGCAAVSNLETKTVTLLHRQVGERPRLSFPEQVVFGIGTPGEPVRTQFEVRSVDVESTRAVTLAYTSPESVTVAEDAPRQLFAGESGTVRLTWIPRSSGELLEDELMIDLGPIGIATVRLRGTTESEPQLTIEPERINTGDFFLEDTSSRVFELVLANKGGRAVEWIAVQEVLPGVAEVELLPATQGTLSPFVDERLQLRVTPNAAGEIQGRIRFHESTERGPILEELAINGRVCSSELRVTPSPLDFGDVSINVPHTREVRLENAGNCPLRVERPTLISNSALGLRLEASATGYELEAGEVATLRVRYEGSVPRGFSGGLDLRTNLQTTATILPILGKALSCADVCPYPNGTANCLSTSANEACQYVGCDSGYFDANDQREDGCETVEPDLDAGDVLRDARGLPALRTSQVGRFQSYSGVLPPPHPARPAGSLSDQDFIRILYDEDNDGGCLLVEIETSDPNIEWGIYRDIHGMNASPPTPRQGVRVDNIRDLNPPDADRNGENPGLYCTRSDLNDDSDFVAFLRRRSGAPRSPGSYTLRFTARPRPGRN